MGGDGVRRFEAELRAALPTARPAPAVCDVPRAAWLAHEAEHVFASEGPTDLAELEPLYVRPSDARLPATPLRVEP